MSCAACQTRVEKAVSKVPGVSSCSVSLLTNSMGVEGNASASEIIKAVTDAGYGAREMDGKTSSGDVKSGLSGRIAAEEDALTDRQSPVLKKRLIWSVIFLVILLYFSMGHVMWGWPLPSFFDGNHVAMGLVQMLLSMIIMVINQKFFISGFKSLLHGAPNMDTLVALGSGASFAYSFFALLMMTDAQVKGDMGGVMHDMHELYFESAAMIVTLITVGKLLEAVSKGRTTSALKGLMALTPKTAVLVKDGIEQTVPASEIRTGDIFIVRPGESIPADAVVIEGEGAVNEAALTGESIPADKKAGDAVSAGVINQSGFLKCQATRVGEDTTLSQIIQMVSDAAATKAPIARIADRVSAVFVPAVIGVSLVTILIWLLTGADFGYALARGISVLVISCPCALGLATPVAIMVGNGMGARNGIMFKTSASLEETGKTQIVVLDKTGTITSGTPEVTDVIPAAGSNPAELLQSAFSLEVKSEHPLAGAIVKYAAAQKLEAESSEAFRILPGNGLEATIRGHRITGGKREYILSVLSEFESESGSESGSEAAQALLQKADELSASGRTPLFFAEDDKLLGIIAVADVIRPESVRAVSELKHQGIRTVMLTGDNARTAKAIAAEAGVDNVVAGVLPGEKEAVIRKLREQFHVTMVGDGINDAPALTAANIGIAIGAGTDVAIDAADVVLMKSSLTDVPAAIRLSRRTLTNIHENLFWAFIYNVIGIPLAAGAWIHLTGWTMNPMFGAAAMSLSSFCVVSNALRLNLLSVHASEKDTVSRNAADLQTVNRMLSGFQKDTKTQIQNEKENRTMNQKTMKIEGMMCGHCEMTVKGALEAIPGVEQAEVSHEKGTAVVTLGAEVSDQALTDAVTAKDYKVISVQ